MWIESKKDNSQFNNKYWMTNNMISALSEYTLDIDAEILAERCNFVSSLYIYVDDISSNKLLSIFNNSKKFIPRDFIPEVPQDVFDEIEKPIKNIEPFSKMTEKYNLPSLVKIVDWK